MEKIEFNDLFTEPISPSKNLESFEIKIDRDL